MKKKLLYSIILLTFLNAEDFFQEVGGKLSEEIAYSYYGDDPHNKITSLKSSLLLDYEYKFENGWKLKSNIQAYYDAIYDLKRTHYSNHEINEFQHEVELFDAYLEGEIVNDLDIKLGRQVVVWGRSDTIRITDILNPLDNRRPGMVDIENLRLPIGMMKFDYFVDDWRMTPIIILEQRFSKNPPFGSPFYPAPYLLPSSKNYNDSTYALSIGGEFSNWDIDFYTAKIYNDSGYIPLKENANIQHDKVFMFGMAQNFLSGSWLFKTEISHLNGLKYTSTQEKEFTRTDLLIGTEYNGLANTMISYDFSLRHFNNYDNKLLDELNPLENNTYQQAFRINSNFLNDTLHLNYLVSLFGSKLNKGGYQRIWAEYDITGNTNVNVGILDIVDGSIYFDTIKNNDIFFMNINYFF